MWLRHPLPAALIESSGAVAREIASWRSGLELMRRCRPSAELAPEGGLNRR